MGAELWIPEIYAKTVEKYEKLVAKALRKRDSFEKGSQQWEAAERQIRSYNAILYGDGYFWDPYNRYGMLSKLGLSWWYDVAPRLKEDEGLSLTEVIALRDVVAACKLELPTSEEFGKCNLNDEGLSLKDCKLIIKKHQELLKFLNKAIELRSPITCWL